MYNSFTFQQYVCYTTLRNKFRAARCSSSGGPRQMFSLLHLASSLGFISLITAILLYYCFISILF